MPYSLRYNSMISDLVWADPSTCHRGFMPSLTREGSYTFGPDAVDEFLKKNNLELMIRAHEIVNAGYAIPFHPYKTVITIFSAPGYCNIYKNKAAAVTVNELFECNFTVIDP